MNRSFITSLFAALIVAVTFAGCERRQSPVVETKQPAPAAAVSAPLDLPPPLTVKDSDGAEKVCRDDMVLVDGDYCEAVAHACLKSKPGNGCVSFKPGVAKCVGTVKHLRFCIDRYEWPNKKGHKPALMQSWYGAKKQCESIGKRLCGDDEWTQACEGPDHLPYPYGWKRDNTACNIDHTWMKWSDDLFSKNPAVVAAEVHRLDKTVPSGSFEKCASPYGVNDMTGNADELVTNVTGHGKPYISYEKGGHWVGGVRNRCRPATESHSPDDEFYDFGFRCCADANKG